MCAKKKNGLTAILAREKKNEKIIKREQYAIQKQQQMKDNAKAKRRKQSAPAAITTAEDGSTNSQELPIAAMKYLLPFKEDDRVLLVGEGDFSFAASIVREGFVKFLVPTALDDEATVAAKYPDSGAANVEYLKSAQITINSTQDNDTDNNKGKDEANAEEDEEELGQLPSQKVSCLPLFSVDGTKLGTSKPVQQALHKFPLLDRDDTNTPKPFPTKYDVVMFNFPHIGNGVKDQARNILQHQQLMSQFFAAAKNVIDCKTNGSIVVSVFEGLPYSQWNLKALAKTHGLSLRRSLNFDWDLFKGYNHRLTAGRGDTTKEAHSRKAKFFVFEFFENSAMNKEAIAEMRKKKRQMDQLKNVKGKKNKKRQYQKLGTGKKNNNDDNDDDSD
ncbi:hypothetical protein D0Z00_002758 [Geotrichum galactomycetum]|uniref:Uncharacterized protein n=1 Tax=Geotrichum galactomycetum TaxID=27317 RepID=A0ACB6V383_9ASCO|nr:hypothetical protein D0Z00_002758 [Geotrichum candidum]